MSALAVSDFLHLLGAKTLLRGCGVFHWKVESMPIQILMPALSPTMTEGTLSRWLKKEGDNVKTGDVIAEIETDKATIEFEATNAGVIDKFLVTEGTQGIAVDTPIAVLLPFDHGASLAPSPSAQATPTDAAASPIAVPLSVVPAAKQGVAPDGSDVARSPPVGERMFVSPIARLTAKEAGIDVSHLTGSGPQGRIILVDVQEAKARRGTAARLGEITSPQARSAYRETPLSSFRKIAARRLTESKQAVPHFYLTIDCSIDELLVLRAEMTARLSKQKCEVKISINDLVIRAAALALRKVPAANASFTETAIREYSDVDISVAVATPRGLITPIIRHADQKSLGAISTEMKTLAARAHDGKLTPDEYQGGSFSISNLGMYGVPTVRGYHKPAPSLHLGDRSRRTPPGGEGRHTRYCDLNELHPFDRPSRCGRRAWR